MPFSPSGKHSSDGSIWNPLVSKVKFNTEDVGSKQRDTNNTDEQNDETDPPLHATPLSFCSDFRVQSGVPVFIFDGNEEVDMGEASDSACLLPLKANRSNSTRSEPKLKRTPDSFEASMLMKTQHFGSGGPPRRRTIFKTADFGPTGVNKMHGTRSLSKPSTSTSTDAWPTTPGPKKVTKRLASTSMPDSKMSHLMAQEALFETFFTSCSNPSPLICSAFSKNGKRMVSGHGNGHVKIWDTEDGRLLEEFHCGHRCAVVGCAFRTPSNRQIVTCDISGRVVLTDVRPDAENRTDPVHHPLKVLGDRDAVLFAPVFSGDGQWVVLRPLHKVSELYRKLSLIRGGDQHMPRIRTHGGCIFTAWNLDAPHTPHPMEFEYSPDGWLNHNLQIRNILISNDNNSLLATIRDDYKDYNGFSKFENGVFVFPQIHQPSKVAVLDGAMATWSDTHLVATWDPTAKDSSIRGACLVFDLKSYFNSLPNTAGIGALGSTPRSMTVLKDRKEDVVHWCSFVARESRMEIRLAASVGGKDIRVIVWDASGGTKIHELRTRIDVMPHECSIACRDGWMLMYALPANFGILWNLSEGVRIMHLSLPDDVWREDAHVCMSFASTSSILSMECGNKIVVWRLAVLMEQSHIGTSYLLREEKDKKGQMRTCKLSDNGNVLGVSLFMADTLVNKLDVWDFRRQTEWTLPDSSLPHQYTVIAFALSPDGKRVVTCGEDGLVIVWQLGGGFEGDRRDKDIVQLGKYDGPRNVMDCSFLQEQFGESVVICDREGVMSWHGGIGSYSAEPGVYSGAVSCSFSEREGKAAVLMNDMCTVIHWDLTKRSVLSTTRFNMTLRQLGKPAVGEEWPMPISSTKPFAIAGLEKDTWKPLICSPMSTQQELKDNAGPIANQVAISADGRCVVFANFRDMYQSEDHMPGEANSIWVVDMSGTAEPKELVGLNHAPRSVAISGDGRTIACVGIGSHLAVWSAYGCQGCLPDYYRLSQDPRLLGGQKSEEEQDAVLQKLLDTHGPSILNYPDCDSKSIFMHFVKQKQHRLLCSMLEWANKNRIEICLHSICGSGSSNTRKQNALQVAIEERLPDIVTALTSAILNGHVNEMEIHWVFQESLLDLAYVYPSVFHNVISDKKFLREVGEVMAPESAFLENKFLVATSMGCCPPHDSIESFWRNLRPEELRKAGSVKARATAKIVPYPNIAQIGNAGILRPLLVCNAPVQVFGTDPVRAVIAYKWGAYGRAILLQELVYYSIMLLLFTAYSILKGYNPTEHGQMGITGGAILIVTTIMGLFKLLRLGRQMMRYCLRGSCGGFSGMKYWASSGARWLEIASLVLLVFLVPVMHLRAHVFHSEDVRWEGATLSQLVAVLSILLWSLLLYYAQPFKPTGPLVVIIQEILKDMKFFLALAVSILFGFGVAFFVLFNASDIEDSGFSSLEESLVTTFGMMLGEFDTAVFYKTTHPPVSLLLFVAYMMAMMIVLLNLLIAIMGDTFDKVTHTREVQFLKVKAKVIDDVETMISARRQKHLKQQIGTYLHVLEPVLFQGTTGLKWHGRMVEIQKNIWDAFVKNVDVLEEKLKEWKDEQGESQRQLESNQNDMRNEIVGLREQNNKLFEIVRDMHEFELKKRRDSSGY